MVDRLQDDWTIGTDTLESSENILSIISRCYREYGLEINGSKTLIRHILMSDQEGWRSELSAFLSHRRGGLYGSRLEEFLSLSLRLQLGAPGAPVLNYALSIIEGRKFSPRDIEILESFLLKAAAIAPGTMDRICRIILNINHIYGCISIKRISERFLRMAEKHFENGALFEVIWLLYTIRGLKYPINSSKIMACAEGVPSSSIRLLLLDMTSKGLCMKPAPAQKWENEINQDRILSDWSWLFSYEGIRKGWLNDRHGVMNHPFFKIMNDKDINFYDPNKNIKRSTSVKRDRRREYSEHKREVLNLLRELRGVDLENDWSEY